MRVVRINTTAWSEEDFYLETDLTIEQIEAVIKPIVLEERNNGKEYDNYTLTQALDKAYPNNDINHYMKLTTISI
jgi:hypothetical protein